MKAADIDRMDKGPLRDEAGRIYSETLKRNYPDSMWVNGVYDPKTYYAGRDKAHALAAEAVDRFLGEHSQPEAEITETPANQPAEPNLEDASAMDWSEAFAFVRGESPAPANTEPAPDAFWDEAFADIHQRDPSADDDTVDWADVFDNLNADRNR